MKKIFSRPQGLTNIPFHYCPGCTHGIVHRIIGEVLEELDICEETIGIAPVGCAGFSLDFFNCDFVGAAHGRAQAVAEFLKSQNVGEAQIKDIIGKNFSFFINSQRRSSATKI